ncbi:MAG: hypothetical protein Q9165_007402 [Trypethelium subeluteriae]
MLLVHALSLRFLFLLNLSQWARISLAENASVAYSPLTREGQQVLGWTGGYEEDGPVNADYLKLSLKRELQKRLSPDAWIVLEGEKGFAALDARYTDYKRPRHIAAVQVAEERDVIETVNYARSRGIQFAARSGGHSLTTSHRRIQNAIAIDMRKLDGIKYSEQKQQMTVGGGITTGQFANATFAKGMEVTVGSCPCTGVLGISLGAGIGRLQGKYGYLNDNMVSIRLLLANGTVVEASEDSNQDLFWALRGAGHNFGIALEATYQVYPQGNDGKHFIVDFEFELEKVEAIFEAINNEEQMEGSVTQSINDRSEDDAAPFIEPFDAISPIWKDAKTAAWDALPWSTYNGLNNILCTPEGWSRFPIKNFYAANVKKYDIPTMRSYFDGWRELNQRYGGNAMFSVMFESFPQQGVREKMENATAYPWRHGSDHFLMIEAAYKSPVDEDLIDEWLSKQQDAFIETSGYGRLQQYINYGHGSKDAPEALYGYEPWRLEKLRRLKKEFDPEGWFNGYQPFVEAAELDGE